MQNIYNRLQGIAKKGKLKIGISYNEAHNISGYGRGNELTEYYLDDENRVLYYSIVRTANGMATDYECFLYSGAIPVTNEELDKWV